MAEEEAVTREERKRVTRGGLIVGLVLISLGVIFLLDNFFPGFGFGRIWPVIIIVWGFAVFVSGFLPPFNINRLFQGMIVGTIGAILLYNTLGIVSFGFWLNVIALWPVFLIAAGFAILGGVVNSKYVSALAPIIIIASLILAFVYQGSIFKDRGMTTFDFSQKREAAIKQGLANIDLTVGNFDLGATDKLYDIKAREFVSEKEPLIVVNKNGSTVDLTIKPQDSTRLFSVSGNRERDWSVLLSKDIEWQFDIRTGVSKADLDLSNLKVSQLDLEGGVGDITVRFGDKLNKVNADINAGISKLRLSIPGTVGVRLKVDKGISSSDFRNIDLRKTGTREENVFETPGFEGAAKKLILDVNVGVSSFVVEGY